MGNPLAIVMICHNDISHLKRSIMAVLGQMTPETSFLFVDDCSTDGSPDYAKSLVGDRGTVVESPERLDVGGARNLGIAYLNSLPERPEYVWFHDSDDYIPEGGVARVLDTLHANPDVDIVSLPIGVLRNGGDGPVLARQPVSITAFDDAANTPVGAWSKVFKLSKYVPSAEHQMCEHVAWHYLLFDQMDTWTGVPGDEPCYVWDRTNPNAISDTVDYCAGHSITLLGAALGNELVKIGKNDRWISDNLRNIANMYDVRLKLKRPGVRRAWELRFRNEVGNFLNGFHVH